MGQASRVALNWEATLDSDDPASATVRVELGGDEGAFDPDEDARVLGRQHSGEM